MAGGGRFLSLYRTPGPLGDGAFWRDIEQLVSTRFEWTFYHHTVSVEARGRRRWGQPLRKLHRAFILLLRFCPMIGGKNITHDLIDHTYIPRRRRCCALGYAGKN